MKKKELTEKAVLAAIKENRPTSITALSRSLGYSGSVSSWLKSKLVELVPDIAERIEANKGGSQSASKSKKPKKVAKKKASSRKSKSYPRDKSNPFRVGSAYATAFDILAHAGDKGMSRGKLVDELARPMLRKKGESKDNHHRRAYFNVTVLASSRKDGRSHRCISKAADNYYVERTNGGWLKLVLRDRKF